MQHAFNAQPLNYLLYTPDSRHDEPLPMIVFLHGSGERGTDVSLVKKYGLPYHLESWHDFPFIVLSPQCPTQRRWDSQIDVVMALMDTIITQHNVERVYLTGFSMGAQGAWYLAAHHPARFKAMSAVAGRVPPDDPDFPQLICALREMPVWVMHGERDDVVSVENAHHYVELFKACGGVAKLTLYSDKDHGVAKVAYAEEGMYQWFLSHR